MRAFLLVSTCLPTQLGFGCLQDELEKVGVAVRLCQRYWWLRMPAGTSEARALRGLEEVLAAAAGTPPPSPPRQPPPASAPPPATQTPVLRGRLAAILGRRQREDGGKKRPARPPVSPLAPGCRRLARRPFLLQGESLA